jgi:hypothetical protein
MRSSISAREAMINSVAGTPAEEPQQPGYVLQLHPVLAFRKYGVNVEHEPMWNAVQESHPFLDDELHASPILWPVACEQAWQLSSSCGQDWYCEVALSFTLTPSI